jgi:hypothetical protein
MIAANDNRVIAADLIGALDAWIAYGRVVLDLDPNPDLDRDLASVMTTPVHVPCRARAPPQLKMKLRLLPHGRTSGVSNYARRRQ